MGLLLFGKHSILEAVDSGKVFEKILVQKGTNSGLISKLKEAKANRATYFQSVPKEKLDRLIKKNIRKKEASHQGIIGFLSWINYYRLDDVLFKIYDSGQSPLLVILDGVTDVRNFGAIARSAECLGAHAIVIPQKGSAQINAEAMKTSAGALNKLMVCKEKNLKSALRFLKLNGIKIYATDVVAKKELSDFSFSEPCAIVLGSEEKGVSKSVLEVCDEKMKIPQTGSISSLNVSVAAGVILYQIMQSRKVANS